MPEYGTARLRQRIKDLDRISMADMTHEQTLTWRDLERAELEARVRKFEFLDSLVSPPMTAEEREKLMEDGLDGFVGSNTGDGMDRERMEEEALSMSDWEFAFCFRGMEG